MNPQKYTNLTRLGKITTPFKGRTRGEPVHMGVDIANVPGTTIPALEDGVVTAVGPTSNGMGNVVETKDREGKTFQYGHLAKSLVRVGDVVKKKKGLAIMGKSGNSYSPSGGDSTHLDVRIVDAYKRYVDPTAYLT